MTTGSFSESDLCLVTPAPPADKLMTVGDCVMLNSGGPEMLVVDADDDCMTCSAGADEMKLPRACVTRVR